MKTSESGQPSHHILIVEDEPQLRGLLADNLEFEGFRATSVESAEAGVFSEAPSCMIPGLVRPNWWTR